MFAVPFTSACEVVSVDCVEQEAPSKARGVNRASERVAIRAFIVTVLKIRVINVIPVVTLFISRIF